MIDLQLLARLSAEHAPALDHPVATVRIAGVEHDLDAKPMLMGVLNLSRDSTYRESVAVGVDSALRRARTMVAQGAGLIDVGAEATSPRASLVGAAEQSRALVPVIETLAGEGIATSVEAYHLPVLADCLRAGARVVNLTGTQDLPRILELAGEHDAAVVLCYLPGATVREVSASAPQADPYPALLDHFAARIEQAGSFGVTEVILDPGLGFSFEVDADPLSRARRQAAGLLGSFRLRELGRPLCQSLPHAFDLFEEEFRTAEGFFAVLARLARVNVLRTHEVARVAAVLRAMDALG